MTAPATSGEAATAHRVAETYYDSGAADAFYERVWGGEDIHIGLYEADDEPIRDASRRTVDRMAASLPKGLQAGERVLDLGAGYGGAARRLAALHGCEVDCLNISEVQNERNRQLTASAGLQARVRVTHGTFEEVPFPDGAFDVVWSQDALLHSGDRRRALAEALRVLRPGGFLIFTDPMAADGAATHELQGVLDRLHLSSMGSFAWYRSTCQDLGFGSTWAWELTPHMVRHYRRVREELEGRREELCEAAGQDYVDRMLRGLEHWVAGGEQGRLAWGILRFVAP